MAGDGDGRYSRGTRYTFRFTTEQAEKLTLISAEMHRTYADLVRDLLDVFADLPAEEREQILARKVSAA